MIRPDGLIPLRIRALLYMLTKEQEYAKERLLNFIVSSKSEIILTGTPGTGKTFFLAEFLKSCSEDIKSLREIGLNVKINSLICTATTNKASNLLRKAKTIYTLLGLKPVIDKVTGMTYLEKCVNVDRKDTLYIIDEASMISSDLYKYIQEEIKKGNKFMYVGDINQLPPVNDNNFSVFNLPNLEVLEFTKILRTNSADLQGLIIDIRDNMKCPNAVIDLLHDLKDSEHIHILKDEEDVKQVLENFTNCDKCIAYTNKRVNKINGYIRALRKMPKNISAGDLVVSKSSVCNTDNSFRLCCEDVLTVKYIKQDSRNPGAYLISFLNVPGEFRGFNDVYKYDTECKRIYAECKKKKNFTAYANFSDTYLKLKFSYASTVHSAQGSTYNKVFVDLTDINSCIDIETFIRLIYVAISRAKDEVYIYYGD